MKRGRSTLRNNNRASRNQSHSGTGGRPPNKRPNNGIEKLCDVVVPKKDHAKYRLIKLENGLKALLISTKESKCTDPDWTVKFRHAHYEMCNEFYAPTTILSYLHDRPESCECDGGQRHELLPSDDRNEPPFGIAVAIGTGSLADPAGYDGLAHFVEHVVHLGTETRPHDNDFVGFICNNRGIYNAFTDKTATCYYAVVPLIPGVLNETCNRYSEMLTKPLLDSATLTREVESVDNEYYLRKVSPFFRYSQLLNVLTIPKQDHPLRKFICGSKETLVHPDSANPSLDLLNQSRLFVDSQHYAGNMAVVVHANATLDFIQNCVVENFSKVPERPSAQMDGYVGNSDVPFNGRLFNRLITAKPLDRDDDTLFLSWGLNSEVWKNEPQSRAIAYLEKIFTHEAPGGIAHYLRHKQFITAITIFGNNGSFWNEYTTLFTVAVFLTQTGRDNVEDVLEGIFSFLKMHRMHGPQDTYFDRIIEKNRRDLEYLELDKSISYCYQIGLNMLRYPNSLEYITVGGSPNAKIDKRYIQQCLNALTPRRANYFLFTSDTGTDEYMIEEIYGTKYFIQDFEEEVLERFDKVNIFPQFQAMLSLNPYLVLAKTNDGNRDVEIQRPHCLLRTNAITYTCQPSPSIRSPQMLFSLNVSSGIPHQVARANRHLLELTYLSLQMEANCLIYNEAELGFQMAFACSPYTGAIDFQAVGIDRRSTISGIQSSLRAFNSFGSSMTEAKFNMLKNHLLQIYFYNTTLFVNVARDLQLRLKFVDYLTTIECHERLKGVSFEQYQAFFTEITRNVKILATLSGKIYEKDAQTLAGILQQFKFEETSPSAVGPPIPEHVVMIAKTVPLGEKCLRMTSLMPNEKKFIVFNHYQLGHFNMYESILVRFIHNKINSRAHHQLRTREQLGYCVGSHLAISDRLGINIYVIAHLNKHSPCYIDHRIDEFLQSILDEDLVPEKIRDELSKKCVTLTPEIVRGSFEKYFLKNSPEKAKLSIQIMPLREDGNCLCNSKTFPTLPRETCREFQWCNPVVQMGKDNIELAFAKSPNNDTGYFISSIQGYHFTD